MPAISSSWADEVEASDASKTLPPPTEKIENGFRIITEYSFNDKDQKVKIVRTFKLEKRIVSKTIAARKAWAKFGNSADDRPGPNPATTLLSPDEIMLQVISNKEEDSKITEENVFKNVAGSIVKCRQCNGDHWTSKCPYKDTVLGGEGMKPLDDVRPGTAAAPEAPKAPGAPGSKYVPPSMREGGNRTGDSMQMQRRDDTTAIRISNLPENMNDGDLEDLCKPFGAVHKVFLAKEKYSNTCKGFAYVHFRFKADAAKAIAHLNGYGYDHLILSADWSKPAPTSH